MTAGSKAALTVHFDPLLPMALTYGLLGLAVVLALVALVFFRRGLPMRVLCMAVFFTALLNP